MGDLGRHRLLNQLPPLYLNSVSQSARHLDSYIVRGDPSVAAARDIAAKEAPLKTG